MTQQEIQIAEPLKLDVEGIADTICEMFRDQLGIIEVDDKKFEKDLEDAQKKNGKSAIEKAIKSVHTAKDNTIKKATEAIKRVNESALRKVEINKKGLPVYKYPECPKFLSYIYSEVIQGKQFSLENIHDLYAAFRSGVVKELNDPSSALYQSLTRCKLSFFTHSNRAVAANVQSCIYSKYASDLNDLSYASVLEAMDHINKKHGYEFDIKADASLFKVISIILKHPCLMDIYTTQDAASNSVDFLDQTVLLPIENQHYIAASPKIPYWQFPSMDGATKMLGSETKFKVRSSLGINSNPQNTTKLISNIAGNYKQMLFMPYQKRWVSAKKAIDHYLGHKEVFLYFIRDVIEQIDIYGVLNAQNGNYENNFHNRSAWKNLGRQFASFEAIQSFVQGVLEKIEKGSNVAPIDESHLALMIYRNIPSAVFANRYIEDGIDRTESYCWKSFKDGFLNAKYEKSPSLISNDKEKQNNHLHVKPNANVNADAKYILIDLYVSDADVGSSGMSIGIPNLTAIDGFLHATIERKAGLKIKQFKPVFYSTKFEDTSLNNGRYEKTSNCILSKRFSNTSRDDAKKILNPSFTLEARASIHFSLLVELSRSVLNENLDAVVQSIKNAIRSARFAGGYIENFSIYHTDDSQNFSLFGLSLKSARSPSDPQLRLVDVLASVADPRDLENLAKTKKEEIYRPEQPIGLIQSGFAEISRRGEKACLRGEEFELIHVEPIYKAFHFCSAFNQEAAWFKREVQNEGRFIYQLETGV